MQSGHVPPGLSLRVQLADYRLFFVWNSEQLLPSLAGTQQCGQVLVSAYVILGSILGALRVYTSVLRVLAV